MARLIDTLTQAINRHDLCPSDLGIYTWLHFAVDERLTDFNGHPLPVNERNRTWIGKPWRIAYEGFNDPSYQNQVRDSLDRLARRGYITIAKVPRRDWTITLLPLVKNDWAQATEAGVVQ